jgi:hypothetical protein
MGKRLDPEVATLARISSTLELDYVGVDTAWQGSPFAWIRTRPSRQRGAIGENLLSGWLAARSFNVLRSPDTEADRIIEARRVEIKFSTLWESGNYKFQQIRDQNYDMLICLGVSPFDAHCWVLSKAEVLHHWKGTNDIPAQHGGAAGKDTAWLTVRPESCPQWLAAYGGSLRQGLGRISAMTGFKPKNPNG